MQAENVLNRSCNFLDASLGSSSSTWKSKINISNRENKILNAKQMVLETAVIIFCRRGCCMSLVVKRLLQVLGVSPKQFEVLDADMESQLIIELNNLINDEKESQQGENTLHDLNHPAVFVGGKSFGGIERVVSTHITGDLVPILKKAGALWL